MYSKGNKLTGASRKTNTDDLVLELFALGGSTVEVKLKLFESMKNCRELEPQVNFRATEKLEKMPKIRGLNEGAVTLEERGHQDESGENRWNPTTVYIGTFVPLNHNQKVPGDRQGT